MNDLFIILRWIHVLAAAAWFGEVLVINFVIIPAMEKLSGPGRHQFMTGIFPRVFKLASVLAATTVVTGALLLYWFTKFNFEILFHSRWGIAVMIGGTLGLIMAVFHFFIEHKLIRLLGNVEGRLSEEEALAELHVKVKIIPRVGLALLTIIMVLMMFAVRGL